MRPRLPVLLGAVQEADGVTLDLLVPADLAWFEGHFPGQPVLPGVVQLDWVMRLAAGHLGIARRAGCDLKVKFRRIIGPDTRLTLDLRVDGRRLAFAYRCGDEVMSSGTVVLP